MSSRTLAVRKSTAYTVALVVALLFGVLALVEPAIAAPDVPATPIDGNKSCADLGLGDYELRLEGRQLQNGTYTDGTLSVTLSNSVFSGGELKSFDWSSNIGVDAVLVKAGTGENQYLYDPPAESKGDDGLVAYQNRGVSHISFCYDLELKVSKTAETSFTRTHGWEIDKSVSPGSLDLFRGDSAEAGYAVEATKTGFTDSDHAVSGTITVTNDAPIDAPLASVTDQIEGLDDGVEVDCGVDFPYTLEAGEDLECTYSAALEDASERTNTATATLANGTGFDGEAAVSFDEAAIEHVNDEVDVDDDSATPADPSDDRSFAFDANDASETFDRSYERTFSCDADEGTHTNTATIRQTNDSDDASVQVNCYDLGVRKTADTSLVRKYTWTIDKSADQSELTLSTGQKFPVNYSVKVDTTSADSGYKVSGTITVSNPAPMDATLASVTDTVSGVIAADVECPDQLTVPAGGTLTCTYEANLPDRADRDNTATATLLNTPNGITDFSSASVPVRFANATVNTVDETITVTDSLQGNLGTVTAGVDPLPKTFNYTRDVGPYAASGDYRVDNVASLVTNDTGTTGEDDWTVVIHVPNTGCTLTIGYWKTHAGFTGNNADMVSRYLPISLGTTGGTKTRTVTTATQAVTILKMDADASNGINKLYAQLLAAKLNVANGADGSAVATTISAADTFLAKYNAASWSSLSKSERQKVVTWASKLDEFNNGVSGPGHCSEARTTSG
jgi:hypothetical protein